MRTTVWCTVACCLVAGTLASADGPVPVGRPSTPIRLASDSAPVPPPPAPMPPPAPPAPVAPALTAPAVPMFAIPAELPGPTDVGVPCGPCGKAPCVPEVKKRTRVVYSCTTREYCKPTRSFLDCLLVKCGLMDECDADEPAGQLRTRRLLVKKIVPVCDGPAVAPPGGPVMMGSPLPGPRVSVYPPPHP